MARLCQQPPQWLIERHGEVWDFRVLASEGKVAAFRHVRLDSQEPGSRSVLADSWPELSRLLDEESEFDAECERRRSSSRRWRASRATTQSPG